MTARGSTREALRREARLSPEGESRAEGLAPKEPWKIERTVKKPGDVTRDHRRVLVRAA
jgi:hypothetical protein